MAMPNQFTLGIIGGSGVYSLPGLEDRQSHTLETPFGSPSGPLITGMLAGHQVAFLARHGEGHFLSPSEVPYRANIYAFKLLGVNRLVSISACGSLRDDFAPGEVIIPNQIYDHTRDRKRTFFGDGLVAHVSVADPFCLDLSESLFRAVLSVGGKVHKGGALITIEGPRFSTRAESNTYRAWGMSAINMSSAPEAFLAREAEICYAVMAHVTDYDVWHVSEKPVTVEMVVEVLNRNTELAQETIRQLVQNLPGTRNCDCETALADALITDPDMVPSETRARLDLLVGKYMHG